MFMCVMPRPFEPSKRAEFDLFNETASSIGVTSVREGSCDLSCYEKMVFPPSEPWQTGEGGVDTMSHRHVLKSY